MSNSSSIPHEAISAVQIFTICSNTLECGGFKMIALVLMHQNGWTLHKLSCAKELQEEFESLEAANPPPAFSLLPTVWLVHRAHKLGSVPIIVIILMPYPVLMQKGVIGFENSRDRPLERTQKIPVGLFYLEIKEFEGGGQRFSFLCARIQRHAKLLPEEVIYRHVYLQMWMRMLRRWWNSDRDDD